MAKDPYDNETHVPTSCCPSVFAIEPGSSLGRGRRRRERGPRVQADRVTAWIDDHGDGSGAVRQVEGEPGFDCSPQLLRFPAAGLEVGHLDINHSVERGDVALRDA